MNTIKITRHTFTVKASNIAKYGEEAPKDGYINSWSEEVQEPGTPAEWDALETWLEDELQEARQAYKDHMGYPCNKYI